MKQIIAYIIFAIVLTSCGNRSQESQPDSIVDEVQIIYRYLGEP